MLVILSLNFKVRRRKRRGSLTPLNSPATLRFKTALL
jgi:hypothetical protein